MKNNGGGNFKGAEVSLVSVLPHKEESEFITLDTK